MKRHKKSKSPSVKSERDQRSQNKKIRNAKMMELPDGTKFRSKLELFTYQKLLEAGIKDFKYEVDKFILQEAFEFPNESIEAYEKTIRGKHVDNSKMKFFDDVDHKIRAMTYLPDFTCIGEDKKGWVLEVKGFNNDALRYN